MIVQIPVGTVIHNLSKKTVREITKIGERILIACGGHGGKGNYLFRSSKNTSPERFQEGLVGEAATLRLELKLIADVGFVGFPNIGKSSLLNELTRAQSKVANYAFTTLEPNLGAYYDLILADIPGLIEGASDGKGLGIKFLRHIERTRIIFHFISAEANDHLSNYKAIRNELGKYNPKLLDKKEYIIVSKSDTVAKEDLEKIIKKLKKVNSQVLSISIYDQKSLEKIKSLLSTFIDAKKL